MNPSPTKGKMKPSERIHDLVKEAREREEKGGYIGKFVDPDRVLSAILVYLDEQAENISQNNLTSWCKHIQVDPRGIEFGWVYETLIYPSMHSWKLCPICEAMRPQVEKESK